MSQISVTCFNTELETPIEELGLLHMRGSVVEGFILSLAGTFRPYIEFRETHKSFTCSFWKPSGLLPQRGGGVHIEDSIETQQYGLTENFEAKNVWDTAYLVPKHMGNNFHRKMVSISNFQFYIVLYTLGQHSLHSKFFSFWKQYTEVFIVLL